MKTMKIVLMVMVALLLVMTLSPVAYAAESAEKPAVQPVNINTATAKELTGLEGIGKKYAQKIVEYRTANGPFQHPEDIMKVAGIGPATWEKNKGKITIGSVSAKE